MSSLKRHKRGYSLSSVHVDIPRGQETKISLLRHAKAGPVDEDIDDPVEGDLERELVQEGEIEIRRIERPDIVISSIARRAWRTAELATGLSSKEFFFLIPLSTHKWSGTKEDDWQRVEELFVYQGDGVCLKEVYENADAEQLGACKLITDQALAGLQAILQRKSPKSILISGHALHLQALGVAIVENSGHRSEGVIRELENLIMKPGEMFQFTGMCWS